jgi:hypothetical protein
MHNTRAMAIDNSFFFMLSLPLIFLFLETKTRPALPKAKQNAYVLKQCQLLFLKSSLYYIRKTALAQGLFQNILHIRLLIPQTASPQAETPANAQTHPGTSWIL